MPASQRKNGMNSQRRRSSWVGKINRWGDDVSTDKNHAKELRFEKLIGEMSKIHAVGSTTTQQQC